MLLEYIDKPEQLHTLNIDQLEQLAGELREYIIKTVSQTGGHLAPSLGAVELTLALYSTFHLPVDKVVWDVGHQAYAHKILTGRREQFKKLRQKGGITGFPCRKESAYDAFGVGHASTSISGALGMAAARDILGRGEHVIAVIGDGAMTGGEAFEALNHAGDLKKNLIVVLNDNGMSIDCNVGAMSEYLSKIRVAPQYRQVKEDLKGFLRSIPHIGDTVVKTAEYLKDGMRAVLVPGEIFEEMGFVYVGPIDGHNIAAMKDVFERVRLVDGPVLVHVHTKKGKGYLPAELQPDKFHGVGKFDIPSGKVIKASGKPPTYTSVFSDAIVTLAEKNTRIAAITAAMPEGTGLKRFSELYPERYFDVGIAEEHAVTLAAGMATAGIHPVVAIYSSFAQRSYDQLMHDVCLQNLPVTLCLDRAGLVGADGATHHGAFDLSYLRTMPGMVVMAPKDENELRHMLYTAVNYEGPAAVRYPRGEGIGVPLDSDFNELEIGKAEVIRDGGSIAILAVGTMVSAACKTAELLLKRGINCTVVNMRFIKPLDKECILQVADKMEAVVTMEENVLNGGFGSAVVELLADEGRSIPVLRFGIPDEFIEQGTQSELREQCGLTPEQMSEKINDMLNRD
ncbi:1-deoxy-D-xylulose-5-phosphate synthase [Schwartzia succinivorans]|jgi:1-deoxy-D-xylulose-5-phosphate synthase|uniref:1-deoxy-D-xylulose-5-phosphate synthase n=1 Tax=Schwartzia succinivorans DSM 10502 TaxID=1123243 RepID=A0A1M4W425_9FIRM|nr:1-deoxy-D-xylulose-5-phosphate synthase [Schwartzia succinivorans]SHE75905.1 1-deoxy-D-xylulose-5-phosphate synthase [Schwartzia succinivorans DSM 10502]